MSNKIRLFVIGSTIAAAITSGVFIYGPSEIQVQSTADKEGFTPKPIIPTKNDVPTIAFGTTVYPDGKKVKMTDPAVTREQGMVFLRKHMDKEAQRFNQTILNIPIYQHEYDVYTDFVYQFGIGNWSSSSMLKNLKMGKYKAACDSLLKWKYVAKRDCSIRSNGCYGVWTRQVDRYEKCMGANS